MKAGEAADVFMDHTSTHDDIRIAGLKLFVYLYGGKEDDTLSNLRYLRYMKMASGKLIPEKLPPTERAAYFHCLRVFHQVQEWSSLNGYNFSAINWGWRIFNDILVPIMTDEPAAADELLNILRCNCQMSSQNTCGTSRCSCRSNGLKCVPACGDCRGIDCRNSETPDTSNPTNCDALDDCGNVFESILCLKFIMKTFVIFFIVN